MEARPVLPRRSPHHYGQSTLVLGAAQLGGAYGIANTSGAPDQAAAEELLRAAARWGVTHVDTARAYGGSELRIGTALRSPEPPAVRVVTKVAPLDPALTGAEEIRVAADASLAESLRLLEPAPAVTVLLHRADDALRAGYAVWLRLRELLAEGQIERIGISLQSPAELLRVIDLPDLGYLQLPCNVLDYRWEAPEIAEALNARPDLVVTVRSVYLQGLLASGDALAWPHLADGDRDVLLRVLDGVAADLGLDGRAALCVAFILGLPWVTSVVIGAETLEQLRENVQLATHPGLGPTERHEITACLPRVPEDLLNPSQWGCR